MIKITPNNNIIEFKLNLQNLKLSESKPRLVLEVGGKTLFIPLEVSPRGYCKGVIPMVESFHNKKGKLEIEVISENFYFKPYETEILFETKKPKKVIKENTQKRKPLRKKPSTKQ
jgi:hypothetical protein